MDNGALVANTVAGAVAALVGQIVKSEKWSRWVTVAIVLGLGVGASQVAGSVIGDQSGFWGAFIAATSAITTHSVAFAGTPLGKALKVGVWDVIIKAVAEGLRATKKDD